MVLIFSLVIAILSSVFTANAYCILELRRETRIRLTSTCYDNKCSFYKGNLFSAVHRSSGDGIPASTQSPPLETKGKLIKLPLFQIIKNGEINAEIICEAGDDLSADSLQACMKKFGFILRSLMLSNIDHMRTIASNELNNSLKASPSANSINSEILKILQFQNIYSDEHLNIIAPPQVDDSSNIATKLRNTDDRFVVLKIHRSGCKRCAEIDNVLHEILKDLSIVINASSNANLAEHVLSHNWAFLQADVENIPKYAQNIVRRLIKGTSDEENSQDCPVCLNSGLLQCPSCHGKGVIIHEKTKMALFCTGCVGNKKIRCTNCGGKCIKCAM